METSDGREAFGGLKELNVEPMAAVAVQGPVEADVGSPGTKRMLDEGAGALGLARKKARVGGSTKTSPVATPTSRGRRDDSFNVMEENDASALQRRPRTTVDVVVDELRDTLRTLPTCLVSRDPSTLLDGLGAIFSEDDLTPIAPLEELTSDDRLDLGTSSALEALRRVIVDPTAQEKLEVADEKTVSKLENHIRLSDDPFQMPSHLLEILGRGASASSGVISSSGADGQLDIARCKLCSRVMLASRFRKHQSVCPMTKANAAVAANPYSSLNNPYGLPSSVIGDALAAAEPKRKPAKADKGAKGRKSSAKLGRNAAGMSDPLFAGDFLGGSMDVLGSSGACNRGLFNAPPPVVAGGPYTAAPQGIDAMNGAANPFGFGSLGGDMQAAGMSGICQVADGPGAKKRKKTTLTAQLNKGPAPAIGGDNDYDLDHSCSVVFTSGVKLGMRCTESLLTCRRHTTEQKKKVVGRSLPYDQLIKKLIAERKAAHDAGARVRAPNHANSNRYAPIRVPKPLVDSYATSRTYNSFFRRRSELKDVFKSIFHSSRTYNQPSGAGAAKGKAKGGASKSKKADQQLLQKAQQPVPAAMS